MIFGGPSQERGVSINSARTVVDQLKCLCADIVIFYVDINLDYYLIKLDSLYSNTPDDFDFKCESVATYFTTDQVKDTVCQTQLVFPLIHGEYGEGGELFRHLNSWNIPYVGCDISIATQLYNKVSLQKVLKRLGYPTVTQLPINVGEINRLEIEQFMTDNKTGSYIVKPQAYGSSIGVYECFTVESIIDQLTVLSDHMNLSQAVIEPKLCGREFTLIVLGDTNQNAVSLIPTEIVKRNQDDIFDYRKKYLLTENISWLTPPSFNSSIIAKIREQVEHLISEVGQCDYLRIDGWYSSEGEIYLTDVNPVSGMEQNSFLFHQTSLIGLDHTETIYRLIQSACLRNQIALEMDLPKKNQDLKTITVLFGGSTSERQVSLMSGVNTYLKLKQSRHYQPDLFLLENESVVWKLPEHYALYHSVEDVLSNCYSADTNERESQHYQLKIREKLGLNPLKLDSPISYDFDKWLLQLSKNSNAYLFIALHGGFAENGELQKKLEQYKLCYNGSNSAVSAICIDKFKTSVRTSEWDDDMLAKLPKKILMYSEMKQLNIKAMSELWQRIKKQLAAKKVIIKPTADGCSTGVVCLSNRHDFRHYIESIISSDDVIQLSNGTMVSLPKIRPNCFLLEPCIELDRVVVHAGKLEHKRHLGWIELTVGLLETRGQYIAFQPSVTLSAKGVLSVEEKFQSGTGVNLTPPPESLVSEKQVQLIQTRVALIAKRFGVSNYARVDVFFNCKTDKLILIEINTLPALTPSTVLFHQALSQNPPMSPLQLIETIISLKDKRVDSVIQSPVLV